MKKITVINKSSLDTIADALDTELVKLGRRLGLSFKARNGVYSNGLDGTLKIEFVVVVQKGQEGKDPQLIKAEAGWSEEARTFGLRPAWLGKTITFKGEKVKILGLFPNRPKFPVLVKGDGKSFLLTAMAVKNAFAAKKVA